MVVVRCVTHGSAFMLAAQAAAQVRAAAAAAQDAVVQAQVAAAGSNAVNQGSIWFNNLTKK